VEIQELGGDTGEYTPVEVQPREDVGTGGVFQLRQGQQRRLVAKVSAVPGGGRLPLVPERVVAVAVGCPCVRSRLQRPLDSYQEDDLGQLRLRWGDALSRRREYLETQLKRCVERAVRTDAEAEREQSLVEQWVALTEERNSVLVPAPGSGVPGAPPAEDSSSLSPSDEGLETHSPVLFLDLNADDLSTGYADSVDVPIYGSNSILPKEHGGRFFPLPASVASVVDGNAAAAVCNWDSSVHDSPSLNRVTPSGDRAYLIVKAVVRFSHPSPMDLVLRKRICFNVYKRFSLTDRIRRSMGHTSGLNSLGVVYEVVSNVPKVSQAERAPLTSTTRLFVVVVML